LTIPAQFGLPALVVRETSRFIADGDWPQVNALWRWANGFTLSSAIILSVLAGVIAWAFLGGSYLFWILLLSFACVPFQALGNLAGASLRGLGRTLLGQLPESVVRPGLFAAFLLLGLLLPGGTGAAQAMAFQLLASVLALAAGLVLVVKFAPFGLLRGSKGAVILKVQRRSIIPLGLASGALVITQSVGLVVLGVVSTEAEVALMRLAVLGGSVVALGLAAVNMVTGPRIAQLYHKRDYHALQSVLTRSSRLVLATALLAAAFLVFFGGAAFSFAVGERLDNIDALLAIVVFGQLVNAFTASSGTFLTMTGHERLMAKSSLALLAATAVGSFVLSPVLGALGAALALSVSLSFYNLFLWWAIIKLEGIDTSALGLNFFRGGIK